MISTLLTKIIGSRNDRTLKALRKIVKQINAMEPQFEALSDSELQAKTLFPYTTLFRSRNTYITRNSWYP